MDYVAEIGMQVAARFPSFETAGLASSWTGVYDVTPDWNPVLGRAPGIQGLILGFGFSVVSGRITTLMCPGGMRNRKKQSSVTYTGANLNVTTPCLG